METDERCFLVQTLDVLFVQCGAKGLARGELLLHFVLLLRLLLVLDREDCRHCKVKLVCVVHAH